MHAVAPPPDTDTALGGLRLRVVTGAAGAAPPPVVTLCAPLTGAAVLTSDAGTVTVPAGGLVLPDPARPGALALAGPGRLLLLHAPRTLLTEPDEALRRATGRPVGAAVGTGRLLVTMARTLGEAPAAHPPAVAERLAGHLADLLSALIAELADQPAPPGPDLLADIRWYVNTHLGDPGLGSERIAAAHRISVRYLHKLFEREGVTLRRWVQRRRLEECRREIGRAGGSPAKIASVAHRWGFADPAHFSRAFRTAFGTTPRTWRATRTQPAPPTTGGEPHHRR